MTFYLQNLVPLNLKQNKYLSLSRYSKVINASLKMVKILNMKKIDKQIQEEATIDKTMLSSSKGTAFKNFMVKINEANEEKIRLEEQRALE